MTNIQCNTKGNRCELLGRFLQNEKGQISTCMQAVEVMKGGKKSIDLRLLVGGKPSKKEQFCVFNVCPFCEGRLYESAA